MSRQSAVILSVCKGVTKGNGQASENVSDNRSRNRSSGGRKDFQETMKWERQGVRSSSRNDAVSSGTICGSIDVVQSMARWLTSEEKAGNNN